MPTLPIVPDLNELEHGATRLGARREDAVDEEVSVAKKLSTTALSQQLPMRLMLGVKPAAASSC